MAARLIAIPLLLLLLLLPLSISALPYSCIPRKMAASSRAATTDRLPCDDGSDGDRPSGGGGRSSASGWRRVYAPPAPASGKSRSADAGAAPPSQTT